MPSIGSTTQRTPLVPAALAALLPQHAVVGPGSSEPLDDQPLAGGVHGGDDVHGTGLDSDGVAGRRASAADQLGRLLGDVDRQREQFRRIGRRTRAGEVTAPILHHSVGAR